MVCSRTTPEEASVVGSAFDLTKKKSMEKQPTDLISIIPVLPSANIKRDVAWYKEKIGFAEYFSDSMYAVLYRDHITIHLQWHADTADDPLLGGSVIRINVKNINSIIEEFIERGTVTPDAFKTNTPWNTNEFGFFDLNRNAIFIMEDV